MYSTIALVIVFIACCAFLVIGPKDSGCD